MYIFLLFTNWLNNVYFPESRNMERDMGGEGVGYA